MYLNFHVCETKFIKEVSTPLSCVFIYTTVCYVQLPFNYSFNISTNNSFPSLEYGTPPFYSETSPGIKLRQG